MLKRTPEALLSGAVAPVAPPSDHSTALAQYDVACRALAEARAVDEVKDIRDKAAAMAAYAKQAKNKQLEAHAIEIRMRATRRLGQMIAEQKATVGLNSGTAGKGRPKKLGTVNNTAPKKDERPTLLSQGIDDNLAKQARRWAALSEEKFKQAITNARDACQRVLPSVVKGVEAGDSRRRSQQGQTPSVRPAVATLLDACVQLDEADAVFAHLKNLRNPCDIVVAPEKFEAAARSVRRKLATRQRARKRAA
jgi:hypothetical protein